MERPERPTLTGAQVERVTTDERLSGRTRVTGAGETAGVKHLFTGRSQSVLKGSI